MMRFPIGDSHVHPDCSVDATGSIDEFCRKALELGLSEITFTTHYEVTPAGRERYGYMVISGEKVLSTPDSVQRYIDLVHKAGDEYYPQGLKVLCGLEIGWHQQVADRLLKEVPQFDLDLKIGAVHEVSSAHVASSAYGPKFYSENKLEHWVPEYFSSMEEVAESGLFDVLAHIDLYKRHGLPVYGDALRTVHRPHLESLFTRMVEHDLGLEVNTSGIRHGIDEYYPSFEILNEARRAGVEIRTLGSDAHAPDQLAIDFDSASQIVHELLPCTLGGDNES